MEQLSKCLLDAKSHVLKEKAVPWFKKKYKIVKKKTEKRFKRCYTEKLAIKAQKVAEIKNMKTVYQITKNSKMIIVSTETSL